MYPYIIFKEFLMYTLTLPEMEEAYKANLEQSKQLEEKLVILERDSHVLGELKTCLEIVGKENTTHIEALKKFKLDMPYSDPKSTCEYAPYIKLKPMSFTTTTNYQCGMQFVNLLVQMNLIECGYVVDNNQYPIDMNQISTCSDSTQRNLAILISNAKRNSIKIPLDMDIKYIIRNKLDSLYQHINQTALSDYYGTIGRSLFGSKQNPWKRLLDYLESLGDSVATKRKFTSYNITDYFAVDVPDGKALLPSDGYGLEINGDRCKLNSLELGRIACIHHTLESLYLARFQSPDRIYAKTHDGVGVIHQINYFEISKKINNTTTFPVFLTPKTELHFRVSEKNPKMLDITISSVGIPKYKTKNATTIESAVCDIFKSARINKVNVDHYIVPDNGDTTFLNAEIIQKDSLDLDHYFADIILHYTIPQNYLAGLDRIDWSIHTGYDYLEDNTHLKTNIVGCSSFRIF